MGKRIQFPIDMSMPWILTDHILTTKVGVFIGFKQIFSFRRPFHKVKKGFPLQILYGIFLVKDL